MTAATTSLATGEHFGAANDIAPFFVLGATLDPKVKAKIRQGAYVELGSLSSPTGSSVYVSMGADGLQSVALTPVGARPPATILEWIRQRVCGKPLRGSSSFILVHRNHHRSSGVPRWLYMTRLRRAISSRVRHDAADAMDVTNWALAMDAIQSSVLI